MANGKELLQELQDLVSEPGQISEEVYRRLLLTATISILTKLENLCDNPMVFLGETMKKHPKIVWFLIIIIIAIFTFVDLRDVAYAVLDMPIRVPTVIPTLIP